MASGLPFHVVPQGQNHLAYFVAFDFGPQAFDIKLLGPHSSDWRQLAVQNMILPPVGSRTLHGE